MQKLKSQWEKRIHGKDEQDKEKGKVLRRQREEIERQEKEREKAWNRGKPIEIKLEGEMKNPIPLIETGADGTQLILNEEAASILQAVRKQVVIISIVGLYRTGKSYLLNRLMGRSDGFPLGSTIQSKTKGIWMWIGDHPRDPEKALLLLDTEGLADPEKGSKDHDTKLFVIAVLLSSVMVYNSKGTIDNSALETLNLATEMSEHIVSKSDSEQNVELVKINKEESISQLFPTLIWAVRDHFLEMKVNDKELTDADEYLEHCLKLKPVKGKASIQHNNLREPIRGLFKNRHCFVFPAPCSSAQLKILEEMTLEELNFEFQAVSEKFIEFVYGLEKPKIIQGNAMLATILPTLITKYLDCINANIPVIMESTFDMVVELENKKVVDLAVHKYAELMEGLLLPASTDNLMRKHEESLEIAAQFYFSNCVINDKRLQEFADQLTDEIAKRYNNLVKLNDQNSRQKCEEVFKQLRKDFDNNLKNGAYTRPGGYAVFMDDLKDLEVKFLKHSEAEVGPCQKEVLARYRVEMEIQQIAILQADESLTQKEKELKNEQMENENREKVIGALENQVKDQKEHFNKMIKMSEDNFDKMKTDFENRHKREMDAAQANINKSLAEQQRLVEEGYKQKSEMKNMAMEHQRQLLASQEQNAAKERELQQERQNHRMQLQRERDEAARREMEARHRYEQELARNRGGGRRGGCFPASCLVFSPIGEIKMTEIKIGTKVLVADKAGCRFEEVIGWMDRFTDNQLDVVVIHTEDGSILKLSDTHNVFKWDQDRITSMFARNVIVGDKLIVYKSDMVPRKGTVTKVYKSVEMGIYSPLTRCGTIVVNNVLTSCYASFKHNTANSWMKAARYLPVLLCDVTDQDRNASALYVKLVKSVARALGPRVIYDAKMF